MPEKPQVVNAPDQLRAAVKAARAAGKTIGVVPTMGALHAGHLSLVDACTRQCGYTVVTIFVNPTQFGPGEDFERYPRTLEKDLELLSDYTVDAVFVPSTQTMYPEGFATFVEVGPISEPWEGQLRPGHFRGVATVVLKLFNLVCPDVAFFGQKDYQQTLVVKQLVRDLNLPIEIHVRPTVREADGLAMSSRNAYLSPEERSRALVLSRSLQLAQRLIAQGERRAEVIGRQMQEMLSSEPEVAVQYAVIVHPQTLVPVSDVGSGAVALLAAKVGTTRLIDNAILVEA